jgi:hypothetical protein
MSFSDVKNETLKVSFHIPNEWKANTAFNLLLEHQHSNIELFEENLAKMGYADNLIMVDDYLHFMILDLLKSEGIEFIERNEIKESEALKKLFNNLIPNVVIKSEVHKKRFKPLILIIDMAEPCDKKTQRKVKKYKKICSTFDAEFILDRDLFLVGNNLLTVFHIDEVTYLFEQLERFSSVHQMWLKSLKLKKKALILKAKALLENDNAEKQASLIIFKDSPHDFDRKKFILAMEKKAECFLFKDGL